MNIVILTGRLTATPELRQTANTGKSVTSFALAVNRHTSNSEETDFPAIVVWGKLAEFACKYLHKGQRIVVEGSLQTRTYEDVNYKKHNVAEVVADRIEFADSKPAEKG